MQCPTPWAESLGQRETTLRPQGCVVPVAGKVEITNQPTEQVWVGRWLMSDRNQARKIRERNVLAIAKLIVALIMSWKSELGLQLDRRCEAE